MKHVLVVEDDSLERKALERMFELCYHDAFSVVSAVDGRMALDRFQNYLFELVLLDINLPDKSGLELLRRMKEIRGDVAVIMATAYSDYEHLRAAMRDGSSDYLIKPYSMATFKEAVDRYLSRSVEQRDLFGSVKSASMVRQYLDEHYAEDVTLDELARLVNRDRSYVGKLFKREYGSSIFSYLLSVRIRHAKELLAKGMSVGEVSVQVGFSDPAYFGKCFKREVGTSPAQFVRS